MEDEIVQAPHYRGRGKSTKAKKDTFNRYYESKKAAADLESRNNHHLILYPASDVETNNITFYIMGGNSAIIYAHDIAPRIGRKKVALKNDTDKNGLRFPSGICMIADLEKFETLVAEIGVKRQKDYGKLKVFKLPREYNKEEINAMLKIEQKKSDQLNKLAYANVLYPDVHQLIIDLQKAIPPKIKKMSEVERSMFSKNLIDPLLSLTETYSKMTYNLIAEEDGTHQIALNLVEIIANITVVNELKIWNVNDCIRIGTMASTALNLLNERIAKKKC